MRLQFKKFSNVFITMALLAMVFVGCKKDKATTDDSNNTAAAPTASFTVDKESGTSPLSVTFTNTSTNAASYSWDFGDGSTASTDKNPVHTFTNSTSAAKTFTTTLSTKGTDNSTVTATKVITVNPVLPGVSSAVFNTSLTYGTMTDQDGNTYKTIVINGVTWMAQDIRTTKYNDGIPIPNVTVADTWTGLTTGAYCNYKNTSNADSIATFGRLYNWYAVNSGKLAPTGWHVATNAEWAALKTYLGGSALAGGKMKEIGTTHWNPNYSATNESGFTSLPSGCRGYANGAYSYIGLYGQYWTSSASPYADESYYGYMYSYSGTLSSDISVSCKSGLSVRCVKD